jgi:hypothetical protein
MSGIQADEEHITATNSKTTAVQRLRRPREMRRARRETAASRTCPQKLDRSEVENFASWSCNGGRQRLLEGDIARAFFERVVTEARRRGVLSDEHVTVDGTLIEAWASLKSFKRMDAPGGPPDDPGNPTVNFHGERRSNATHASTTDPEARLFRKGDAHEAKLYTKGMSSWTTGPAWRSTAA